MSAFWSGVDNTPTSPAENWGADLDQFGRQDKSHDVAAVDMGRHFGKRLGTPKTDRFCAWSRLLSHQEVEVAWKQPIRIKCPFFFSVVLSALRQERRYLMNAAMPKTTNARSNSQITPIPTIIPIDIPLISIIIASLRPFSVLVA
jgi:hypothetical protein